eukprot:5091332-Pyramimonas_sp.AAC.1
MYGVRKEYVGDLNFRVTTRPVKVFTVNSTVTVSVSSPSVSCRRFVWPELGSNSAQIRPKFGSNSTQSLARFGGTSPAARQFRHATS